MTDRWVCARCFTSAEDSATVCPNCGLPRGASPEYAAGEAPPSADAAAADVSLAPPPAPSPAWRAEERWVCRRCFSSNDGTATACANCGQLRDAGASPQAADGWAGAPAQPAGGQGRQFPWRLIIGGVIAVAVIGSSYIFSARRSDTGEITDQGDVQWADLQVGDCFDFQDDAVEVQEVTGIPCANQHDNEIYWAGPYPGSSFPTMTELVAWAEETCLPAFEEYVGISFESSVFYIDLLSPTEGAWDEGSREVSCYMFQGGGVQSTGSARGAAQ